MVHLLLQARKGCKFPSPGPQYDPDEVRRCSNTLGVPIFQEQAMKSGRRQFSPDEANQLRKAMATFRSRGTVAN
jgi:error-prone DNA polymerase